MTTSEMDAEAVELLRERLFRRFRRQLMEEMKSMERSHTQEFHRVLSLWVALEQAIQLAPCAHPSESTDPRVQSAWEKLTAPENVRSLENLFYQLSDPRQIELAMEALRKCRAKN